MPGDNMLKRMFRGLGRKRCAKKPTLQTEPHETDAITPVVGKPRRTTTLTDLPPELRLLIYSYLFTDFCTGGGLWFYRTVGDEHYDPTYCRLMYSNKDWRYTIVREVTAILQVCRATWIEASPVFWNIFVKTVQEKQNRDRIPLGVYRLSHMRSLVLNLVGYAPEAACKLGIQLQLSSISTSRFRGKGRWDKNSKQGVTELLDALRFSGVVKAKDRVPLPWKARWRKHAWMRERIGIELRITSNLVETRGPLASLHWTL